MLIAFICAVAIIAILWSILYFPTKWLIPKKYLNNSRWIITIIIGSFLVYFYVYTSPAYNHEDAVLKQKGAYYELTLTGERVYMSHDLVSALKRATYTDTIVFLLPRNHGVIQGKEIQKKGGYPLLGNVELKSGTIKVQLYYDNFDDHIKEPLSYNGNYRLKKTH